MLRLIRMGLIVLIGLATSSAWVRAAPDAPGDLDPTFGGFGTGGQVFTYGLDGPTSGVVLQPDGKIVVIGDTENGGFVRRYLPNGTLDQTFGDDGKYTFFNSVLFELHANAVALQSDGKIVVAGTFEAFPAEFILIRVQSFGLLDYEFGENGFVTTTFSSGISEANAVLVQPDGKIVVAGNAFVGGDADFAVARFNSDGTLDDTFGGDGRVTIGLGGDEYGSSIARQADGKLVVAGSSKQGLISGDFDFAIARLNSDGTLDSSFDGDGKVTSDLGEEDLASAVFIQPDGKIAVVGDRNSSLSDGLADEAIVVRYHPDGSLDDSFAGDGVSQIGSLTGQIDDGALQPDGKILLLGYHTSPDNDTKLALYRLNPDGSTDLTFNGDGDVLIDFGFEDKGTALALQPDGRIIAYGSKGNSFLALVRLWPDGTFDAGGQQTLGFADPLFGLGSDEVAYGMAVQSDGKFVVAGEVINLDNTESEMGLARFRSNGQLDTSFGEQGRIWFGFGRYDVARAVALQSDGKIVATGFSKPFGNVAANFLVARFNPDGTLDHTFAVFGFNVVDFASGDDYGHALALAPDGKIVVAGEVWNGSRYVFGVARLLSNGALDTSFDGDGKAFIDFVQANSANAVAVQPDRKIIVAGHAGQDFAVARLREDGLTDFAFGPGGLGLTLTDMGGSDDLKALLIAPNGWLYAAGSRDVNGNVDFALAQYQPNGVLATCSGFPCSNWPTGKQFIDWGGSESASAIDWRDDGRIVAAGSANGQFAWAQLRTGNVSSPIKFTTDFAGADEQALGVKYVGSNKIILAGYQEFNGDHNMALARFETTANPNVPVFKVYLPSIIR